MNPAHAPRQHGRRNGQQRMPGGGKGHGHGGPQHEAAVGGEIGNVQHPEAQEQRQRHRRIEKAQLQCSLYDKQHDSAPFGKSVGKHQSLVVVTSTSWAI